MTSHVTAAFRERFRDLPEQIQRRARANYLLWKADPHRPGIGFKRIHSVLPLYSVRVGLGWRAVGRKEGDAIIWFWIGSHAEYDALLHRLG